MQTAHTTTPPVVPSPGPDAELRLSASQISTWFACRRKWGWTYLVKLRSQPTASQALGTDVHAQVERYIQGYPLDFTRPSGEIAQAALEHLPTHGATPEREFHVRPPRSRHHWWGFKDIERDDTVWDLKTTSDLKWAKTPEDLLYDPQAVLYAYDNGAPEVQLNWVYVRTRGKPVSKRVHLPMSREHAQKAFEILEDTADELAAAKKAADVLDGDSLREYVLNLPYNSSHCEVYGGCQFRGLCNLSPAERAKSLFSNLARR